MKIQFKAACLMSLFGGIIVILLSGAYDLYFHEVVIKKELENLNNISEEIAFHLDSHLKEKTALATTLSSSPLIRDTLLQSNETFAALTDAQRKQKIASLNQQWQETGNINDPFIQARMTNAVAEYFHLQQRLFPSMYGEIFLTNRYGVMIATTGKLTTLAHAHKYWWIACYDDGKGRIFLDDRGFDTSVQGYVLGVVIPIRTDNEIIGLIKCNVNILGPLTHIVQEFSLRHPGRIKIVRAGGLIVSEFGTTPLSTQVDNAIINLLQKEESGTIITSTNNKSQLVAFSPIPATLGSEQFGFGGSQESIDHIKGNRGESWHVVLCLDKKRAKDAAHATTKAIVVFGVAFTLLSTAIAFFLGKRIANPIIELEKTAQRIGTGHLDERAAVYANDEIGSLAGSLNDMAKNLKETMTKRDILLHEIERRKKEEARKEQLILELEEALAEIKILQGILPICSFCKKIRNDQGYYEQIENYIHQHSGVDFSHTVCPECLKKHYPELPG